MEDLQSLLEKINREGVQKADAEAKRIVDEAQKKADAILSSAREEAAKAKADAERSANESAARASETMRLAARDVVLGVKDAVTALFEQLLVKSVDKALADETTAVALVSSAIRELAGPGEIVCGEKLAATLKAKLADLGSFTVVTDATFGTGFGVRLEGGRVEHLFTEEVISAELAKRLQGELAALLKT